MLKSTVDISLLVDMGGKGLGIATLRDIDNKGIEKLYDETYPDINAIRSDKHEDLKKQMGIIESIPT